MSIKRLRESKCDKCQKIFYRKLVPDKENAGKRRLTRVNEVAYWTGGEPWNNYKILCRICLNEWFEKHRIDFSDLIGKDKQQLFYHYRYLGLFKKEIYKAELTI
ncbi:MAG: hypothetical protein MRERV_73c004 [Mycoplasmataceae bacterium RV_VA103A]|nr:MAG: hypothetical protein MRERV_73c004 [Mycoplasmataceae bacterium RV_VA103A]